MTRSKTGERYLSSLLPRGWQNGFTMRRAGAYWGLSIACPKCDARPPASVKYGSQRWRWLAVHMRIAHQ